MTSRLKIVLGLISGLMAAALLALYAQGVRAEASSARDKALKRYGGEVVQVCVTTQALVAGEIFNEENTAQVSWLVDLVPEGVIQSQEELLGKRALYARPANSLVSKDDVSELASLTIPEGFVACSVPCAEVRAVGGAILPGHYVDVYLAGESTQLFAQHVLVLASSSAPNGTQAKDTGRLNWLSLALKPELVESLISAASTQTLYFVLPGQSEREALERLDSQEELAGERRAENQSAEKRSVESPGSSQEQAAQHDGNSNESKIPADLYASPASTVEQAEQGGDS